MELKDSLLKFIWQAHQNTYAAAEGEGKKHIVPFACFSGHVEYGYIDGSWRYQDIYAGFWSPPGKEVVYYQEKPLWTMCYQGKVIGNYSEELVKETYSFLKGALRSCAWEEPFRGPRTYDCNEFAYTFSYEGDYSYFKGTETVSYQNKEIFFQDVMGSLIE